MFGAMKVNNVESYAVNARYWVVRVVDGEAWFYDGFNSLNDAKACASECNGLVVNNLDTVNK